MEQIPANWAQLRHDIDSGRTGDKVGGFDPAAAPLGTDEEAGGSPCDPELIARERVMERAGRPNSARANAATPELQPDGRTPRVPLLLPAVAGLLAAAALGLGLYLQL